jgi:hypothetical protein
MIFPEEQISRKSQKPKLNKKRDNLRPQSELFIRKIFSRMIDLTLIKLENNEKMHRNIVSKYQSLGNESITPQYYTCLKWSEYDAPNDKILPTLW